MHRRRVLARTGKSLHFSATNNHLHLQRTWKISYIWSSNERRYRIPLRAARAFGNDSIYSFETLNRRVDLIIQTRFSETLCDSWFSLSVLCVSTSFRCFFNGNTRVPPSAGAILSVLYFVFGHIGIIKTLFGGKNRFRPLPKEKKKKTCLPLSSNKYCNPMP